MARPAYEAAPTDGRYPQAVAPRAPASFGEADRELARALDALDGAVNYADWIVEMVQPHLGPTILEVGAGHGTLTERLGRHGKVIATDLSPRCVDALRSRFAGRPDVEILHADVEAAVAARTFDSVVLVNVLEHIADDDHALRVLASGLRPGGTLVLFVPAFQALYSEFDRLVGHYRRYRGDELAKQVSRAGFEVLTARYVNLLGALTWWLAARQLRRVPRPWLVRLYDTAVIPAIRRLERRWTPPFGQSFLCIARRPLPPRLAGA